MPYFIYKLSTGSAGNLKNPEFQKEFENFQEAKTVARSMRAELGTNDTDIVVKIIFAENQEQAVDQLLKRREAPILREWEK